MMVEWGYEGYIPTALGITLTARGFRLARRVVFSLLRSRHQHHGRQ